MIERKSGLQNQYRRRQTAHYAILVQLMGEEGRKSEKRRATSVAGRRTVRMSRTRALKRDQRRPKGAGVRAEGAVRWNVAILLRDWTKHSPLRHRQNSGMHLSRWKRRSFVSSLLMSLSFIPFSSFPFLPRFIHLLSICPRSFSRIFLLSISFRKFAPCHLTSLRHLFLIFFWLRDSSLPPVCEASFLRFASLSLFLSIWPCTP